MQPVNASQYYLAWRRSVAVILNVSMSDYQTEILSSTARSGWIRLRTLVLLRWLAISGQILAAIIAIYMLSIELPIDLCVATIGASFAFNVVALTVFQPNHRLSERVVVITLLFDLCQLAFLLYLVGGLSNPFAVLILAPVTIAATSLTLRSTATIGMVALVLISILLFFYRR